MVTIENIFVRYIKHRKRLDKAKIYKLVDNSSDKIYIGSTCGSLNQRLSVHKYHYKRSLKGLFRNVKSFDILKNNNYKIVLLENCNITTKDELLARERYYIENNDCLNKNIPGRTEKEYYIDNKDKISEYKKAYYEANKEANRDKLNEKFDCECGGKYLYNHKARHIKTAKHLNFLQSLK